MAVFFDLDGTLFENNYASMEQASTAWLFEAHQDVFHLSEEEFVDRWRFIQEKHFDRYCLDEITYEEYGRAQMRELLADASLDLPDDEADGKWEAYMDRFLEDLRLYPDVIPCLDALEEMTLGIITNQMIPEETMMKLVAAGIRERFSVVTTPLEAGSRKPQPEIFLAACREADTDPGECLFVGDDLEIDALGCRSAGMQGIWLNREKEDQTCEGVMVINNLEELPPLIKTFGG